MKKTKRNFRVSLMIILALTMLASLITGCAKKEETSASVQASAAPQESAAASETPAPTKEVKEKTEVSFWAIQFEPYVDEWWKKWVAKFNEQSDDTIIKLEIVPSGEAFAQKLKVAQAAGNAPQIVQSSMSDVIAKYAVNDLLMPMDDYVSKEALDNLYPIAQKAVTYQGKRYAYPMFVEPAGVLYYRKDKFIEAGLDPEKPPASWDELFAMGKTLTKKDQFGFQLAGAGVEAGLVSWELEYMLGTKTISDDWTAATVNDAAHKQLFEFWKRLYTDKIVPKQALSPWSDLKALAEGKVAMQVSGSWGLGQLRGQYKDLVDMKNIGVTNIPTPTGDYKMPTTSMGGWFLGIDGKAKNPENAGKFISWLLYDNNEPMLDFFKAAQYCRFPVTNKLNDAVKVDQEASNDIYFQTISEKVIPYALPEPSYPFDIRIIMGSAIDRVVIEGKDIDKSIVQAEKEINEYIKKNDLPSKLPTKTK